MKKGELGNLAGVPSYPFIQRPFGELLAIFVTVNVPAPSPAARKPPCRLFTLPGRNFMSCVRPTMARSCQRVLYALSVLQFLFEAPCVS